jgi:HEAT repeat protein
MIAILLGATVASPSWFIDLDRVHSSYLVVISLSAAALVGSLLYRFGLVGWVFFRLGFVVRVSIHRGFLLWERFLSWASWKGFLAVAFAFLGVGWFAGGLFTGLRIMCAVAPLFMGATACLAYMFIDLERYEVERGHKAVHNPLTGQELAVYVARYGQQVRVPLLIAAAVAVLGGFSQLNQGLYESIGASWFTVGRDQEEPASIDFLAYALINLLNLVDVLNLARSHQFLRSAHVQQAQWPASLLLGAFKTFFMFVLLQQFFASLRQGKLLTETIEDFWSPHELIHDRARNALPQYGALAIEPLMLSLRSTPSLTREQREQLPLILATIGPSTIPVLVRHLKDEQPHVRAIAIAALGHLHAREMMPLLVTLASDADEGVRQSVVEALGILGSEPSRAARPKWAGRAPGARRFGIGWLFAWKKFATPGPLANSIDPAVATLQTALADKSSSVRSRAAEALSRIGPAAAVSVAGLIELLKDGDETVRCRAAEALGRVVGEGEPHRSSSSAHTDQVALSSAALVELLQDASAPVKAAAARALGALKKSGASAVSALVPLLQDRDESVRTSAAEAIANAGALNGSAIDTLVEALASPDTVVRAQTAAALGIIGTTAGQAAPALVEAMQDGNDRVRAKAAEALGKIGESVAHDAVPGLMRALRDQDSWVSAMAAEALGLMGNSADGAIPALVRSLRHLNPLVRGNAAEALGKMAGAAGARGALERAARDEDGGVRSQVIRALAALGPPTLASEQIVVAAFEDADPLVRAAAVASVGQWPAPSAASVAGLAPLLQDTNDQVKVAAIKVLPKLVGATPAVIDGLCRLLLEDDSDWVQLQSALALGQLGREAAAAGGALLRATRTGEAGVREQSMRALAMIQSPEMVEAFTAGLTDGNGDIRKVASGGWIKAASIPEEAIPLLVVALRDPETQVRANAAHALGRLDSLPAGAIELLVGCTDDSSDGLRINAALALKKAPAGTARATMDRLVEDANLRIRLIAASCLLPEDPSNTKAGAVVVEALSDPSVRIRKAALDLVESLGPVGVAFLEALKKPDNKATEDAALGTSR